MPARTPLPGDLRLVRTPQGHDVQLGDRRHPVSHSRPPSFRTVRLICFERFHRFLPSCPERRWREIRPSITISESEAIPA